MLTTKTLAACLLLAAQTYNVPPAALIGIMHVEGGKVGQEVSNTNGSYDLGPMQINTIWMPKLAQYWQVDTRTARVRVRDNACVNIHVAAWILRQKINETGHLWGGIAGYHSLTPHLGSRYATKVATKMQKLGLIRQGG